MVANNIYAGYAADLFFFFFFFFFIFYLFFFLFGFFFIYKLCYIFCYRGGTFEGMLHYLNKALLFNL